MEIKNKKIAVIGLARTGIATANFLAERGADATVYDRKTERELAEAIQKLRPEVKRVFGSIKPASDAELIVLSPGVDIHSSALDDARASGAEIISELELGCRFNAAPVIAVTGTNGKTTTVTLIGNILKKAGKNVVVGGNIGEPFISLVDVPKVDWAVLEVSSFQLEGVSEFHPHIAAVLNITPDHLDRHKTLACYAALKEKITGNQTRDDYLILNQSDPLALELGTGKSAQKVFFNAEGDVDEGAYVEDGHIRIRRDRLEKTICPVERLRPAVRWQMENILAAITIADIAGVETSVIADSIGEFSGLEHRMEWVRSVRGVDFINDSKGTNVGSVQKTLESLDRPVILIMGGQDKGSDFSALKKIFREKVKHMVLIGESSPAIRKTLNGSFSYTQAGALEDAVSNAFSEAVTGDIVLLSPGCASFDMFQNYADRGNQFKNFVIKL